MAIQTRAQVAADRAEQIRLGLQSTAVLYARAVEEEDWKALGCTSVKDWAAKEFGPDRFSPERRKEIVVLLTATSKMTVREIAAATGTSPATVTRDQREARVSNETDSNTNSMESDRRRLAREREAAKARDREAARVAAEAVAAAEAAIAAQAAAEAVAQPEPELTPERTTEEDQEGRSMLNYDAIEVIIAENLKRGQIMERFGVKDHPAQLARKAAEAIMWERQRQTQLVGGRPQNWNGKSNDKRLRELRVEKREGNYLELASVQQRFAQMCVILEDINLRDYGLDDVSVDKIMDIYDDLVSLGEWHGRQLSAIQGYLNEIDARKRIEKLRNVTGRTPEETATALRLADRLEQKLGNRIG